MIAAIYARKSTAQDDVADEAKSVTRQVDGARAFIADEGLDARRRATSTPTTASAARCSPTAPSSNA